MLEDARGFVKVLGDDATGEVLGVHMVGPGVTELIGEAACALGLGADLKDWSEVVHPHPTLSEALGEAVAAAVGRMVRGG
jgi:dihydrolipoamide dehydrogenase